MTLKSKANPEKNHSYSLSARSIPLREEWDLIVAGAGVAGSAAAIAAAREGAGVLLFDSLCCPGGLGSAGMVPGWCGPHDGKRYIHHSIFEETRRRMARMLGIDDIDDLSCPSILHPEYLKIILDDMLEKAGVEVRFFTNLSAVEMRDPKNVDALIVSDKAGLSALKAPVYVDATGDGDLAARAGAEFMKGDSEGKMQPATLCSVLADVDTGHIWENADENWREKIENDNRFPLLKGGFVRTGLSLGNSVQLLNAGHIYDIDGTDPEDLSRAIREGRKLALQLREGFSEHLPSGFKDSFLLTTASLLGVREIRRIVGDYVLTAEDHRQRRSFDDEIARNSFFLDVHHSKTELEKIRSGKLDRGDKKRKASLGAGESHGIPYRCLVPRDLDNVLVAGRNVSADRHVHGAIRVMPPCMSMGEAAGIAAAAGAQMKTPDLHSVDVGQIRRRILEEGGYLP